MGRTGTARSRQVDRYRYRRFGQLGAVERDENLGTAERWLIRVALNRRADLEHGCDVLFDEAVPCSSPLDYTPRLNCRATQRMREDAQGNEPTHPKDTQPG
jgi:hypothetical protein